jgi:hypothetical protein
VRLREAAAEPVQERDRSGDGVAGSWDAVAAGGCGGGVDETVVAGGSVEVGAPLLGDQVDELGMHGWTSCSDVVAGTVIPVGCRELAVR